MFYETDAGLFVCFCFVLIADWKLVENATDCIRSDIIVSSVQLGLCVVCLLLTLVVWRKHEQSKRYAYVHCEHISVVRNFSYFIFTARCTTAVGHTSPT